jgi:hypothetical protein
VSGLVARVSGKVDVAGRTEAAPMGRTIAYCRVSSRDQNPQQPVGGSPPAGRRRAPLG